MNIIPILKDNNISCCSSCVIVGTVLRAQHAFMHLIFKINYFIVVQLQLSAFNFYNGPLRQVCYSSFAEEDTEAWGG